MRARTVQGEDVAIWAAALRRWRHLAWVIILIADAGLLAWGAGAAVMPNSLAGPGGLPILDAGYQGYAGGSWHQLAVSSSKTAGYITLVFRMYGIYIVAFSVLAIAIAANAFRYGERWAWWALLIGNTIAFVSAMTYDRIVGAIGPFEWSEYLGLAAIWGSLAITWRATRSRAGARASTHPGKRPVVSRYLT